MVYVCPGIVRDHHVVERISDHKGDTDQKDDSSVGKKKLFGAALLSQSEDAGFGGLVEDYKMRVSNVEVLTENELPSDTLIEYCYTSLKKGFFPAPALGAMLSRAEESKIKGQRGQKRQLKLNDAGNLEEDTVALESVGLLSPSVLCDRIKVFVRALAILQVSALPHFDLHFRKIIKMGKDWPRRFQEIQDTEILVRSMIGQKWYSNGRDFEKAVKEVYADASDPWKGVSEVPPERTAWETKKKRKTDDGAQGKGGFPKGGKGKGKGKDWNQTQFLYPSPAWNWGGVQYGAPSGAAGQSKWDFQKIESAGLIAKTPGLNGTKICLSYHSSKNCSGCASGKCKFSKKCMVPDCQVEHRLADAHPELAKKAGLA